MAAKLTDHLCRNAKEGMYWDDIGGFGLRVGKKAKTFILMYKRSRESLGRYPALSLAEARTKAKERFVQRARGELPQERSLPFRDAVALYLKASELSKRQRT